MSKFLKIFLCMTLWVAASALWAADTEPTPAQMKEWAKQLGDDAFDKRQAAEQALVKVGLKAKDVLTEAAASKDAQTAATAKKLLGKLRFATLGAVNYFDILPEKCRLSGRFYNVGDSWKNLQKTALGKIYLSKSFDPLRAKIAEGMGKEDGHVALLKHFKGQIAGAIWECNPMAGPNGIKGAFLVEITEGDPQAVFNELLQKSNETSAPLSIYQDVQLYGDPTGKGVEFSIGKNLVIATDEDSAKLLIDRFIETAPKGFNQNAAFVKTKAALAGESDLTISLDFMGFLQPMMPMIAMMVPGFNDTLKSAGVENMKLMTYSSSIAGDSFDERFVMINEGPLTGMAGTYVAGTEADMNEAFGLIPANAVVGAAQYMDGEKSAKALSEYLTAIQKMQEGMQNQMGGGENPFAKIAEVETKLGLKFSDLAVALKGSVGYWAVLAPPPSLTPPDLGAFVTFTDAAKAKGMIDLLLQNVNKAAGKEVLKSVAWKTHTIYQIDLLAVDAAATKCPYPTPCFALVGNRLFLSTSSESLQKQLNNVTNKAPGLLTNPEFVKATASLKADERKGGLTYADLKSLLVLGGNVGLPILAATAPDADFQKFVAGLPPTAELFRDITPLLLSYKQSEGIIMMSVRSPLPASVMYAGLVGVLVSVQKNAMMGGN